MTAPIQDLRDAIALLQQHDNQYLETDHPVDPNAELAGVYRHIGAGGTVKRPTRIGPAMMFNNIKGYPHSRILVGMHAPAASGPHCCWAAKPHSWRWR